MHADYSATLKCHDPGGEICLVTFSRVSRSPASYPDNSIRTRVIPMNNELIITVAFLGAGLPAYVIIPGTLVIWDRVLDHMEW